MSCILHLRVWNLCTRIIITWCCFGEKVTVLSEFVIVKCCLIHLLHCRSNDVSVESEEEGWGKQLFLIF